MRDEVVDFVTELTAKTELSQQRLVRWLGIGRSKFYTWKQRYGKANEHNGLIPRDFWLLDWEREAIVGYFIQHPDEGYRRLTYMMMDEDLVAVSPSTVYRTRNRSGLMVRVSSSAGQISYYNIMYLHSIALRYIVCAPVDGCMKTE